MVNTKKIYLSIDLKSFYASVECMELGLDPLTTNLVVADASKTDKTICLAVTPSLKSFGVPGRPRLFEVVQKVKEANKSRKVQLGGKEFAGKSSDYNKLKKHPELAVDYIVMPPRMAYYIEYSTRIYNVYLKYIAPEDIHVYSIDEVMMDVTSYLNTYKMTAHELAVTIIKDILETTGITATAGIGTNLYLCKIALDIVSKHAEPDADGVRIGELDEMSYRRLLWSHKPITDFWRVGPGYAKRLAEHGMYTMGDVARCSVGRTSNYHNIELLYKLFGVNAELLIDHAWGVEPCTIEDIKAYKPENNSMSSGQVLPCAYTAAQAKLIVWEMTDNMVLTLVEKRLVTDQLVLEVGYDIENVQDEKRARAYKGKLQMDRYGRKLPKHAHGTTNLGKHMSSTKKIIDAVMELYDRIVDPDLLVRRITLVANHVIEESSVVEETTYEQLDFFTDYEARKKSREKEKKELEKERNLQEALISIKKKYGKNAMLKGSNFLEGATARERNHTMGGHKE